MLQFIPAYFFSDEPNLAKKDCSCECALTPVIVNIFSLDQDYLTVRQSQKLYIVLKFTCKNKNGNFVKETDISGYIVV